jgi:hypothetical protein
MAKTENNRKILIEKMETGAVLAGRLYGQCPPDKKTEKNNQMLYH